MTMTVADQFTEVLAVAGVKRIYGIVGDSLNGLTDVLRRQGRIEWVHVRHEEVAAFAACAEAHLTGHLTVCAGSCGPGNLHLINGLFDCHRSRVPVLGIAAHIPSAEIGAGYFQETHPEALFKECSHYCQLISSANQMPRTLEIAIREAVGKRGVSVVVIPGDVALQAASEATPATAASLLPSAPSVRPSQRDLDALAAMLNGEGRVTILCGAGCQDAHVELLALGERLQAPMVHSLRGKEHVEWDNPYDVGMTGLIGFSSGYYAMLDCDVLLLLGTDFPYRQFYPQRPGVQIAQIDIRPENIGRRARIDLGVVGDVKITLAALLPVLQPNRDSTHLAQARTHYAKARASLDDLAVGGPQERLLHPQQIAKAISDQAAPDAVFTCDVGLPTVWAARYLAMNGRRRLLGSFWHGSMANAMAQAIGAQAAYPARQVISLSGDGGFATLMGDFLSLAQLRLPVKVVVFNNGALGFIELEQKSTGFLDFGTELQNPNFAAMAEAVGIRGIRIESPVDVEAGIANALAHDGPVLDGERVHTLHAESGTGRQGGRDRRPRRREPLALGANRVALTALFLSRAQFAFTVSFHIVFPSFTIGLAAWLTVLEALHRITGRPAYRLVFEFWLKIFGVAFGLGVVSGIVLAFEFGTNWSELSRMSGPIQGPLLSYEAFTAFALEASFFGILLFGRSRVPPWFYLFSTAMVALGTTLSAFWIMVNNSWMQVPVGYATVNGTFVPTDWAAIIFSQVVWVRFPHMLLAAYVTGAFCVAATGAWYLLRREFTAEAQIMLRMGLFLAAVLMPVQLFFGHMTGDYVHNDQPIKFAAIEGRWHDEQPGNEVLIGLPDPASESNRYAISIPVLGSLIGSMSFTSKEVGLTDFPLRDRPPVLIPFFAFRIMVGCGLVMLLLGWVGTYLNITGRAERNRLFLRLVFCAFPLPFIATLTGWFTAEVGRQPWTIYGVLRTADAVTPFLTAGTAMVSLVMFCAVYALIFVFGVVYIYRLLRDGPVGHLVLPPAAAVPNRPMSVVDGHATPGTHPLAAGE